MVDRIVVKPEAQARVADSLETGLSLTDGTVVVDVMQKEELLFSQNLACPVCGYSVGEISPRMFSFNSPFGACEACSGLGVKLEVDTVLVIPDPTKSIDAGAVVPWIGSTSTYYPHLLKAACKHFSIPTDVPVEQLSGEQIQTLLYGIPTEKIVFVYDNDFGQRKQIEVLFEGIIPNLERRYRETASESIREFIEGFMASRPCPTCRGQRLRKDSLAVRIEGSNIADVTSLSIGDAIRFSMRLRCLRRNSRLRT